MSTRSGPILAATRALKVVVAVSLFCFAVTAFVPLAYWLADRPASVQDAEWVLRYGSGDTDGGDRLEILCRQQRQAGLTRRDAGQRTEVLMWWLASLSLAGVAATMLLSVFLQVGEALARDAELSAREVLNDQLTELESVVRRRVETLEVPPPPTRRELEKAAYRGALEDERDGQGRAPRVFPRIDAESLAKEVGKSLTALLESNADETAKLTRSIDRLAGNLATRVEQRWDSQKLRDLLEEHRLNKSWGYTVLVIAAVLAAGTLGYQSTWCADRAREAAGRKIGFVKDWGSDPCVATTDRGSDDETGGAAVPENAEDRSEAGDVEAGSARTGGEDGATGADDGATGAQADAGDGSRGGEGRPDVEGGEVGLDGETPTTPSSTD